MFLLFLIKLKSNKKKDYIGVYLPQEKINSSEYSGEYFNTEINQVLLLSNYTFI